MLQIWGFFLYYHCIPKSVKSLTEPRMFHLLAISVCCLQIRVNSLFKGLIYTWTSLTFVSICGSGDDTAPGMDLSRRVCVSWIFQLSERAQIYHKHGQIQNIINVSLKTRQINPLDNLTHSLSRLLLRIIGVVVFIVVKLSLPIQICLM